MDLRKEVEQILAQWGHDILLQRRVKEVGTGVYNTRPNHGFTNVLEKHTVRERQPFADSLTNILEERVEGKTADVDMLFYFRWNVNPDSGDRIYEKDPRGYFTYIIDWAQPFRFLNGRIEYWKVGATLENDALET